MKVSVLMRQSWPTLRAALIVGVIVSASCLVVTTLAASPRGQAQATGHLDSTVHEDFGYVPSSGSSPFLPGNLLSLSLDGPVLTIPAAPTPLTGQEKDELIRLLEAERDDLALKIEILSRQLQMLQDLVGYADQRIRTLLDVEDSTNRLCDARIGLEVASCSCPGPIMRRFNTAVKFGAGGLIGYALCD